MIFLLVTIMILTKIIIRKLVSLINQKRQNWRQVSQHNQEMISDQMVRSSNFHRHRQSLQLYKEFNNQMEW